MHGDAAFGGACPRVARKTGYKMLKSAPGPPGTGDIGAAAGQKDRKA